MPRDVYRRTGAELIDLLDAGALLAKPVRTLSLGERMKCELIAAFLHRPRLVFLDEPTLGLDVTMQRRLRDFIAQTERGWRDRAAHQPLHGRRAGALPASAARR